MGHVPVGQKRTDNELLLIRGLTSPLLPAAQPPLTKTGLIFRPLMAPRDQELWQEALPVCGLGHNWAQQGHSWRRCPEADLSSNLVQTSIL